MLKFCKLFLFCELHHKKTFFSWRKETAFLFPYFHYEISFCRAELFECSVNFKFCKHQRSKISILQEAATYFGSSHGGAFWKHISESKLSGLQLYFAGVFEDFGQIFLTCCKRFIKSLKVGKIFRCVTSFYQHFFVSDISCYHKTNSGNSYN